MKKNHLSSTLLVLLSFLCPMLQAQTYDLAQHKSWNLFYFLDGESFNFTIPADNHSFLKVNGTTLNTALNSFKTSLQTGENNVVTYTYTGRPPFLFESELNTYTFHAKRIAYQLNKKDAPFAPGEQVEITFTEIDSPAQDVFNSKESEKLIYQSDIPGLGFIEGKEAIAGKEAVADASQLNKLTFTLPDNLNSGTYVLSGGKIRVQWTGEPLEGISQTADQHHQYDFSYLPDIVIPVEALKAPEGAFGYDSNEIPSDWENDLWLNKDFLEMMPGDTYQIIARRVPEIIDNPLSNNVVLPTFKYAVVRGNSVSVDVNGQVTAKTPGTSIVEVRYNETEAYGKTFGAVSEVNVTYMVVDVKDVNLNPNITLTTTIEASSYDTYYFTGESYPYSFQVNATGANTVSVRCNDVEAEKEGDIYTVDLKNRANLIEIIASNEAGSKKYYQVIDARKIQIQVSNQTHPDENLRAGDVAHISFKGIVIPVYKLATIYNPMYQSEYGSEYTRVCYQNSSLGTVQSNLSLTQWDLATHNTIELTFPQAGHYEFSNGFIDMRWWGFALGTDKTMSGPGSVNTNADLNQKNLCVLPTFTVFVDGTTALEHQKSEDWRVFPSEVKEMLYFENSLQNGSYQLYHLSGRMVKWGELKAGKQGVNVHDLPAGIYLIRIISDKKETIRRIIKK